MKAVATSGIIATDKAPVASSQTLKSFFAKQPCQNSVSALRAPGMLFGRGYTPLDYQSPGQFEMAAEEMQEAA